MADAGTAPGITEPSSNTIAGVTNTRYLAASAALRWSGLAQFFSAGFTPRRFAEDLTVALAELRDGHSSQFAHDLLDIERHHHASGVLSG